MSQDKVSVFIHWMLAWLLHNESGDILLRVIDGKIEGVRKYPCYSLTENNDEAFSQSETIDLSDPFLSKYMPRLGAKKEEKPKLGNQDLGYGDEIPCYRPSDENDGDRE